MTIVGPTIDTACGDTFSCCVFNPYYVFELALASNDVCMSVQKPAWRTANSSPLSTRSALLALMSSLTFDRACRDEFLCSL